MEVSRATVQMLYAEARKKLARFLVEGISLQIEGGDYELSHRAAVKEKTSDCSLNGLAECHSETPGMEKERRHMKIAVTYEMDRYSSISDIRNSSRYMMSRTERLREAKL